MLKRHGTRLDIGTAEDVAELNAAEALLRVSYKPAHMSVPSRGSNNSGVGEANVGGGGYSATGNAGLDSGGDGAGFNARGVAAPYIFPSGAMSRPTAVTNMGNGSGGVQGSSSAAATPISSYAAGAAALPPHVHLGHSVGRVSPATGGSGPAPASASSSTASVHAQRALYRGGAGGSVGVSPSGRTPGGTSVGPGGVRGTAQPLFHSPRSGEAEAGEEEEEEEVRGRPSMMRAPLSFPDPAVFAGATAPGAGGARLPATQPPYTSSYTRRGGPPAAPLPAPPRYGVSPGMGSGIDAEEEGEDEEVHSRPSRVSGRYHLPRSPHHGDPSAS